MVWGEQWGCGCGTSNLFLRRRCRDCGLPAELAVSQQGVGDVMANVAGEPARRERDRDGRADGDAQRR